MPNWQLPIAIEPILIVIRYYLYLLVISCTYLLTYYLYLIFILYIIHYTQFELYLIL